MNNPQVKYAIEHLGHGFLSHKANVALRRAIGNGELGHLEFHRQLLRLSYRLLLNFVAFDREFHRNCTTPQHKPYRCVDPLRSVVVAAEHLTDDSDLWQMLSLQFSRSSWPHPIDSVHGPYLRSGNDSPYLLGPSQIDAWRTEHATPLPPPALISNRDLGAAVEQLAVESDPQSGRKAMDLTNLGAETFRLAFEPLLKLRPMINMDAISPGRLFWLEPDANMHRKTTGSYYTPIPLVRWIVEATVDQAIDQRLKGLTTQQKCELAILDLKVCDPACGTGRFLIAAAIRLAERLATIRTGHDKPSHIAKRMAFRDVIERSIYGVDIDLSAVDMCIAALWIECLESDTQPTVLDAHVMVGNALLGTTPALMAQGIPDHAFKPTVGDDRQVCYELRRRNRRERQEVHEHKGSFTIAAFPVIKPERNTVDSACTQFSCNGGYHDRHGPPNACSTRPHCLPYPDTVRLADIWCASFLGRKDRSIVAEHYITNAKFKEIAQRSSSDGLDVNNIRKIQRIADQYQLFHWHLAFPHVLLLPTDGTATNHAHCGWCGGFDVVVGNPPWGATIPDRARAIFRYRFENAKRGVLDTFALFTELATQLLCPGGLLGMVLPDVLLLKNHPTLRLHLLTKTSILELAHWGRSFPNVNLDVASLIARLGSPLPNHQIRCIPQVQHDQPATSGQHFIAQATFLRTKAYRFNLHLSDPLMSMLDAASSFGPSMKELFTLREGVHSGNVRTKLFLDDPSGTKCQPLIFGRGEISPMQLSWAGKFIQRDASVFNRRSGEYFNLGDPKLHAARKLLVRRTGDHILAAVDSEGVFCSNNFFLCVPRTDLSWPCVHYVCALLNSKFATWFFQSIQPRAGKLFAELKITHLEDIPIPFACDTWAEQVGQHFVDVLAENPSTADVQMNLMEFDKQLNDRIHVISQAIADELRGQPQPTRSLQPDVANV